MERESAARQETLADRSCPDGLFSQETQAVTKKEIVRTISEEIGLTQLQTKEIVQKTFNAIVEALVEEGRIELRNFGVFEVKRRAPARRGTRGPATRSSCRRSSSSRSSPARKWRNASASWRFRPLPPPRRRGRRPPRPPHPTRPRPESLGASPAYGAPTRRILIAGAQSPFDYPSCSFSYARLFSQIYTHLIFSLLSVSRRSFVCALACFVIALGLLVGTTIGCMIPGYSGDPVRRTTELMYTSENLRLALDEWERFWLLDQPDHMTPYRTHGGLL